MCSVVCVVLNWNGADDTIACVQSLLTQTYPHLQILIVDNASTDDSVDRIRAALPSVELVPSHANHGFASGNNLGIRLALERNAHFVWLLNNDTVVPPDTLTQMVATAENTGAAITGTVLRYLHHPSEVQAWGGGSLARWSGFSRHFYSPTPFGPDSFLTFASVLIRWNLFEQIGLLDENYFMYFEDADFCFRARNAGATLAVAASTTVLHKEGGSTPNRSSARRVRIFTASGVRFLALHGSPRFIAPSIFVVSRLAKRLVRLDIAGMAAVLRGASDGRSHLSDPLATTAPGRYDRL